jgi:hypothetical protein
VERLSHAADQKARLARLVRVPRREARRASRQRERGALDPVSVSAAIGRAYRVASGFSPHRVPCAHAREHIVHVGYHKTASTWLQVSVFPHLADVRYGDPLLAHFVVNLATAADPTFFAAGFRGVLRQLEQISSGPLLLSNEGLSGSLWDGDETGLRNAERLHALLPTARILIAVRRQDEMLRSIHAQYVNEGGTRPLRAFVEGRGVPGSRFSLRHLEYDRLVGRYVDLFGRDRVWVVPYEYLRAWPDRFLDRLCEMLSTRLTAPVSYARPLAVAPGALAAPLVERAVSAVAFQSRSAPRTVAG